MWSLVARSSLLRGANGRGTIKLGGLTGNINAIRSTAIAAPSLRQVQYNAARDPLISSAIKGLDGHRTSLFKPAPLIEPRALFHDRLTPKRPLEDPIFFIRREKKRKGGLFLLGFIAGILVMLSVGKALDRIFNPPTEMGSKRPKIVVLGSGWASIAFLKSIDPNLYDVHVISPRNYFLFTPALTQATFGIVDTGSIAEPIRNLLHRFGKSNISYCEGKCTRIDPNKQKLQWETENGKSFTMDYDKLVMAVGGEITTFGVKGVKENCKFLKDLDDTRDVKSRIIHNLEAANLPGNSEETLKKLLNFVVVGGGPISVEFAAQLHNLVEDLEVQVPHLKDYFKVTFVNTNEQHKNTYDAKISAYWMEKKFKCSKRGDHIEVKDGRIHEVTKDYVVMDKEKIPYGVCVWLTGAAASPLVKSLQKSNPKVQNNSRALLTDDYLQVKGYNNIYALGECATVDQARIVSKWMDIFMELDENHDGVIDQTEFEGLVAVFSRQFPQLLEFAKQAKDLFDEGDTNHDGKLSIDEFKSILAKVDSSITSFPSTAQVAVQQGGYLGESFNKVLKEADLKALFHDLDVDNSGALDHKEVRKGLRRLRIPSTKKDVEEFLASCDKDHNGTVDEAEFVEFCMQTQQQGGTGDWKKVSHAKILPFRYQHLGGFEYVGYEGPVTERGSQGNSILDGFGAWWMWRSIYFGDYTGRNKKLRMGLIWLFSWIMGRDFAMN